MKNRNLLPLLGVFLALIQTSCDDSRYFNEGFDDRELIGKQIERKSTLILPEITSCICSYGITGIDDCYYMKFSLTQKELDEFAQNNKLQFKEGNFFNAILTDYPKEIGDCWLNLGEIHNKVLKVETSYKISTSKTLYCKINVLNINKKSNLYILANEGPTLPKEW